jgi:hypothetical protein
MMIAESNSERQFVMIKDKRTCKKQVSGCREAYRALGALLRKRHLAAAS